MKRFVLILGISLIIGCGKKTDTTQTAHPTSAADSCMSKQGYENKPLHTMNLDY